MANDKELGLKIHKHLLSLGLETPMALKGADALDGSEGEKRAKIKDKIFEVMELLGLDMEDDSLQDTPSRVAKMFCEEIFGGLDYATFPKCTTIDNKMGYDEMVVVRDIVVRSMCEHHLQPIYGRAHIAYIPSTKVLGLSKFERVLAFFAARPQVQERLTAQVASALQEILETTSVAVVIEADHYCMKMRGVKDACASTTTSKMGGKFFTEDNARREVLQLMKGLSHG